MAQGGSSRRLLVLAVLALAALAAACGRGEPPAEGTITPPLVDLVDPTYGMHVAGDEGWELHSRARADLDGDGLQEAIHVIAAVRRAQDGFMWDDGQPWQVYVQERDGEPTYLYARWVQLGDLDVAIGDPGAGGARDVLIVESGGAGLAVHRVTYLRPGDARATTVAAATVGAWVYRLGTARPVGVGRPLPTSEATAPAVAGPSAFIFHRGRRPH